MAGADSASEATESSCASLTRQRDFLQPFSTFWGKEISYLLDVTEKEFYFKCSHFPSF